MRWSAVSADAIAWREFDGDVVLRNERTGSTHMLDRFPAEVMRLLMEAEEPLSVEDLKARLRLQEDDGDGEQWSGAIEGVLREFQRLGLAEPQSG